MAIDESELTRQAIRRDAEAFGQIYDRHAKRVYRYVYSVLGRNGVDAEDLTALTFLKAWEKIDQFQPRGRPFLAWLLRIAHNLAVNHLVRGPRDVALEEDAHRAPASESLFEALEKHAQHASLREALRDLCPQQRAVIALRFFDGMSHADVARILGKDTEATRAIQYRALASLRRLMAGGEHNEPVKHREGRRRVLRGRAAGG